MKTLSFQIVGQNLWFSWVEGCCELGHIGTRLPQSDWGRLDPRSLSDFPAVFADPVMDFQCNHCAMISPTSPLPELVFPGNLTPGSRSEPQNLSTEVEAGGNDVFGMDLRFRLRKHGDSQ